MANFERQWHLKRRILDRKVLFDCDKELTLNISAFEDVQRKFQENDRNCIV